MNTDKRIGKLKDRLGCLDKRRWTEEIAKEVENAAKQQYPDQSIK